MAAVATFLWSLYIARRMKMMMAWQGAAVSAGTPPGPAAAVAPCLHYNLLPDFAINYDVDESNRGCRAEMYASPRGGRIAVSDETTLLRFFCKIICFQFLVFFIHLIQPISVCVIRIILVSILLWVRRPTAMFHISELRPSFPTAARTRWRAIAWTVLCRCRFVHR